MTNGGSNKTLGCGMSSLGCGLFGIGCAILAVLGVLAIFFAVFMKGCYDVSTSMQEEESANQQLTLAMKIVDNKWYRDGNYVYVKGRVKNTSAVPVSFVRVQAEFLNKSGEVVDSDWTYGVGAEILAPGDAKSFEIVREYSSDFARCRVWVLEAQKAR